MDIVISAPTWWGGLLRCESAAWWMLSATLLTALNRFAYGRNELRTWPWTSKEKERLP
jgi:hypothetical protein